MLENLDFFGKDSCMSNTHYSLCISDTKITYIIAIATGFNNVLSIVQELDKDMSTFKTQMVLSLILKYLALRS